VRVDRRWPGKASLLLPVAAATLAGCSRHDAGNPAPPRLQAGQVRLPQQSSIIVVPVVAPLAALEQGLNRTTPRTLWTIDEHRDRCVAAKRVDLGIGKVKITPDLGCRIVGRVTRGAIHVGGAGQRLAITMPVSAVIAARDVGGVLSKTATGSATVHATGRLGIAGDWHPTAKVDIAYDWREPPGIDIAGQRVTFVGKADEKLRGVVARLERDLPKELAKIRLRRQLDGVWRQAFTTIQLSQRNPPAWMRVTPRALAFGGYAVEGRNLRLTLAAEALTETFVGERPADPSPTPLPAPGAVPGRPGLRFYIPVLAEYAQLQPVVQRTLRKLNAKGIVLKGVGPVDAAFGDVTVYATTGGRLAVGVKAKVKARSGSLGATSGEAWLSAIPYNDPGSQFVQARDVRLATRTDSPVVNLLVQLFDSVQVTDAIALALRHDFAPDYARVLAKARDAIDERREGDFVLHADVTKVTNGALRVTAAGLFMPVQAEGAARIEYRPRTAGAARQ
jgi:hypothetical protein